MEKEIWKTVIIDGVEYPRYKVSSHGRIMNMNFRGTEKPRICRLYETKNGYLQVWIDGVKKYVHRLVAEAFIPNPKRKHDVDHVDTNRKNNCVWNLRFCTRKENCNNPLSLKHYSENSAKTMLGKFGFEHHRSIPIVQLTLDGQFIKKWAAAREVERKLGIDGGQIAKCCKGKRCKSAGGFRWMYYSDWVKKSKKPSDIKPLF